MAVYQQKARERIKSSLRRFQGIVERARENGANEADTRMIVTSFLDEALGWDTFANLTGEHRIKGNYADFAIHEDGDLLTIIEVKAVGTTLGPKHLYQAVSYAANEGVEWVWLTNGCDWQVYRVIFDKPVDHDLVFQVSLCDSDIKPAEKVERLYLLTREAQRTKELDAYYNKKAALSGPNIARVLLGERMLKALRTEMHTSTKHLATHEEIAMILVEEVFREDLQGDETAKLIRRAASLSRSKRKPGRPRVEGNEGA